MLNEEVVHKAVLAGLALGSSVAAVSKFDRKQYFYADLPKGYQISQYDAPICAGGAVDVALPDGSARRVGVTRAHLEEDAGGPHTLHPARRSHSCCGVVADLAGHRFGHRPSHACFTVMAATELIDWHTFGPS